MTPEEIERLRSLAGSSPGITEQGADIAGQVVGHVKRRIQSLVCEHLCAYLRADESAQLVVDPATGEVYDITTATPALVFSPESVVIA